MLHTQLWARLANMTAPHRSRWSEAPRWSEVAPPAKPPRRRHHASTIATGVCVVLMLASCLSAVGLTLRGNQSPKAAAATPSDMVTPLAYTLAGDVTLGYPHWARTAPDDCAGTAEYADIREGATVTVTDATGTVIALGTVQAGRPSTSDCVLAFLVGAVPTGKGFYGLEVSRRGRVSHPEDDIRHTIHVGLG